MVWLAIFSFNFRDTIILIKALNTTMWASRNKNRSILITLHTLFESNYVERMTLHMNHIFLFYYLVFMDHLLMVDALFLKKNPFKYGHLHVNKWTTLITISLHINNLTGLQGHYRHLIPNLQFHICLNQTAFNILTAHNSFFSQPWLNQTHAKAVRLALNSPWAWMTDNNVPLPYITGLSHI